METRRDVLKKAAFVTPIILTLPAVASFASAASGRGRGNNDGQGRNDDNPGKNNQQ
jgi:hypothetical protein